MLLLKPSGDDRGGGQGGHLDRRGPGQRLAGHLRSADLIGRFVKQGGIGPRQKGGAQARKPEDQTGGQVSLISR